MFHVIRRIISAILVTTCLVSFSDIALASEALSNKNSCLAPTSRFKPIVNIIKKGDGKYEIVENRAAIANLTDDLSGKFKSDVGFLYISQLIGDAFELGLEGEDSLKTLIRAHIAQAGQSIRPQHIGNFVEPANSGYGRPFDLDNLNLRLEDGSYYLGYRNRITGAMTNLRYFAFVPEAGKKFPPNANPVHRLSDGRFVMMEVLDEAGNVKAKPAEQDMAAGRRDEPPAVKTPAQQNRINPRNPKVVEKESSVPAAIQIMIAASSLLGSAIFAYNKWPSPLTGILTVAAITVFCMAIIFILPNPFQPETKDKSAAKPAAPEYDVALANILEVEKRHAVPKVAKPTRRTSSVVDVGGYRQVLLSVEPSVISATGAQILSLRDGITDALREKGLGFEDIVKVDIYLKNKESRELCEKILRPYFGRAPPISYINQPPANGDFVQAEIIAVTPDSKVHRINEHVTVVENNGLFWAHVAGIEADKELSDTYRQAYNCFEKMRRLIENIRIPGRPEISFQFEDVVRTWLYEERIVDPEGDKNRYNRLNKARKDFFAAGRDGKPFKFGRRFTVKGLDGKPVEPDFVLYPSSTGIGMSGSSFVMEALALSTARKDVSITQLPNPDQTEAFAYSTKAEKDSPLFSRGMAVSVNSDNLIIVSGTASIIGEKTVHIGDAAAQTHTTIDNIHRVICQAGATLANVSQIRVYIKSLADYNAIREVAEARLGGIPCLYLIADVCRPELLVEIEAVVAVKKAAETAAAAVKPGEQDMAADAGTPGSGIGQDKEDLAGRFNELRKRLKAAHASGRKEEVDKMCGELAAVSAKIIEEVKEYYNSAEIAEGYQALQQQTAQSWWRDPKSFAMQNLNEFMAMLKSRDAKKVADVGTGGGWDTEFLRTEGFDAVGTDVSTAEIDKARKRYPLSRYEVAYAQDLSGVFEDDSLDGAWAQASLYHIPYYGEGSPLDDSVKEISKKLKKGGLFYMGVHSAPPGEEGMLELEARGIGLGTRFSQNLAEEEVREMLLRNGFRIIKLINAPQGKRQRYWITVFAEKIGADEADAKKPAEQDMAASKIETVFEKGNIEVLNPDLDIDLKYASFDFDGTLVDTTDIWRDLDVSFFAAVFKESGAAKDEREAAIFAREFYDETCGIRSDERAVRFAERVRERGGKADTAEHYEERRMAIVNEAVNNWHGSSPMIFGITDMLDVLDILKAAGVEYGITSGARPDMKLKQAAAFGIGRYFNADKRNISGSPDSKSRMLLKRKRDLGLSNNQIVHFGDMPIDIEEGKRAGCVTIAIARDAAAREALLKERPDVIIHGDYRRLETLLQVLNLKLSRAQARELKIIQMARVAAAMIRSKIQRQAISADNINKFVIPLWLTSEDPDRHTAVIDGSKTKLELADVTFETDIEGRVAEFLRGEFAKHGDGQIKAYLFTEFTLVRVGGKPVAWDTALFIRGPGFESTGKPTEQDMAAATPAYGFYVYEPIVPRLGNEKNICDGENPLLLRINNNDTFKRETGNYIFVRIGKEGSRFYAVVTDEAGKEIDERCYFKAEIKFGRDKETSRLTVSIDYTGVPIIRPVKAGPVIDKENTVVFYDDLEDVMNVYRTVRGSIIDRRTLSARKIAEYIVSGEAKSVHHVEPALSGLSDKERKIVYDVYEIPGAGYVIAANDGRTLRIRLAAGGKAYQSSSQALSDIETSIGKAGRRYEAIRSIISGRLGSGRLNMLFACSSNAIRSPTMHLIAEDFVKQHGLQDIVKINSGGTYPWAPGERARLLAVNSVVLRDLIKQGIDEELVRQFRPNMEGLSQEAVDNADIVIAAEEHHRREIIDRFPEAAHKVFLLKEALPLAHLHYGEGVPDGDGHFDEMAEALRGYLLPLLTGGEKPAEQDMAKRSGKPERSPYPRSSPLGLFGILVQHKEGMTIVEMEKALELSRGTLNDSIRAFTLHLPKVIEYFSKGKTHAYRLTPAARASADLIITILTGIQVSSPHTRPYVSYLEAAKQRINSALVEGERRIARKEDSLASDRAKTMIARMVFMPGPPKDGQLDLFQSGRKPGEQDITAHNKEASGMDESGSDIANERKIAHEKFAGVRETIHRAYDKVMGDDPSFYIDYDVLAFLEDMGKKLGLAGKAIPIQPNDYGVVSRFFNITDGIGALSRREFIRLMADENSRQALARLGIDAPGVYYFGGSRDLLLYYAKYELFIVYVLHEYMEILCADNGIEDKYFAYLFSHACLDIIEEELRFARELNCLAAAIKMRRDSQQYETVKLRFQQASWQPVIAGFEKLLSDAESGILFADIAQPRFSRTKKPAEEDMASDSAGRAGSLPLSGRAAFAAQLSGALKRFVDACRKEILLMKTHVAQKNSAEARLCITRVREAAKTEFSNIVIQEFMNDRMQDLMGLGILIEPARIERNMDLIMTSLVMAEASLAGLEELDRGDKLLDTIEMLASSHPVLKNNLPELMELERSAVILPAAANAPAVGAKPAEQDMAVSAISTFDNLLHAINRLRQNPELLVKGMTARDIAGYADIEDVGEVERVLAILKERGYVKSFVRAVDLGEAEQAELEALYEKTASGVMDDEEAMRRELEIYKKNGGELFVMGDVPDVTSWKFQREDARQALYSLFRMQNFAASLAMFMNDRMNPTLYTILTRLLGSKAEDEISLLVRRINELTHEIRKEKLFGKIATLAFRKENASIKSSEVRRLIKTVVPKIEELLAMTQELERLIKQKGDKYKSLIEDAETSRAHLGHVAEVYSMLRDEILLREKQARNAARRERRAEASAAKARQSGKPAEQDMSAKKKGARPATYRTRDKIRIIEKVFSKIDEEIRTERFDKYIGKDQAIQYARSYEKLGVSVIRDMAAKGLMGRGKRFGDIGAGTGMMLALAAALTDVDEAVGIEPDDYLRAKGQKAINELHDLGVIDKTRIRWIPRRWQDAADILKELDAAYLYSSLGPVTGWTVPKWAICGNDVRRYMRSDAYLFDASSLQSGWGGMKSAAAASKPGEQDMAARRTRASRAEHVAVAQSVNELIDTVKIAAYNEKLKPAKLEKRNIMIAVEMADDAKQNPMPLAKALGQVTDTLRRRGAIGSDKAVEVKVVWARSEELHDKIMTENAEFGAPLSNIVVLGREATLMGKGFDDLRGRAFLACTDFSKPIDYVKLLAIAMKLAFGLDDSDTLTVKYGDIEIDMRDIANRIVRLLPKAEPIDTNEPDRTFRLQISELKKHA